MHLHAVTQPASPQHDSSFQAPSGQIVRLRSRTADVSKGWFCWAELTPNSQSPSARGVGERRGFMVGPRATVDTAVEGVLRGVIRERVGFAGGEFVVADGQDESLGAWVGPWHSVYGWFADPLRETSSILGYFSDLAFVDTVRGVRISSRRERLARVIVSKQIPGVGRVQIMKGTEAIGLVPSWSGARVRAGELWRKAAEEPEGAHVHLVLASRSAVAVLYTDPVAAGVDEERLGLDFMRDLVEVSWGAR